MNPPQRVPSEKLEELLDRLLVRGSSTAEMQPHLSAYASQRGADCPQDAVWRNIATQHAKDEESLGRIEHAARCQRCGTILSFWAEILSEEETPTETAALARLSSMSLGWQERMTKTLCAASGTQKRSMFSRRFLWPAMVGVAGAIAATGLLFLFLSNSHSQASPERLLAEAYSGHRIMETRIPLAGFAAIDAAHHSRGAGPSAMSDSVPLLEARAAITQALMKTPEDPHWLLLQARSDLLSENYDTAIDTLKRLHAGEPGDVAVLTDLASAYLMRSKATDSPTDEATALDYLEQAVRLEPNNPIVLYNEAVVLQELFQYSNAIDAWKKFFSVEHDQAWVSDGKRRLAEIEAHEAKVKAQESKLDLFFVSPEGMLHLARSPSVVADYDEELSSVYLPRLLKTAFPVTPPSDSSASDPTSHPAACAGSCVAARALLRTIATSLREHHRDDWLADLVSAPEVPGFALAANLLASAIEDGRHANAENALDEARSAQNAFLRSGNAAGVTAARAEQIYNLEHLLDAHQCLAAARGLPPILARSHYPGIEAQFWADEAGCHLLQNDFAAAGASLDRSLLVSAAAGYRVAHLRASGFVAANEESIGNRDLSWVMNLQSLKTYWNGNYPMVRRLLPYVSLAYTEQSSSRFFGAVALCREAVGEAAMSANPGLVNENRFLLIKSEIRAGEMREAARDLTIAEGELAALPGHDALRGTAADTGLFLAEGYLAHNNLAAAAGLLQSVAANMDGSGNRDLEFRYSSAAGHLAFLEGKTRDAEDQLTHAVAIAERGYRETRGTQDRTDWIERARGIYAALALLWVREGRSPLEGLAIWERYRILSSGVSLHAWCHSGELTCLALPLDAARRGLKQETVVGTIRLDHSLLLWTMDDRGIQIHEAATEPDRFDLLCQTFFETLATPVTSEASIRFYGRRLAAVLLAPIAPMLDAHRTLAFDLDDRMEFLPVAALPWNGGYLGLQFAVTSVHSVLLANRRPPAISWRQSIVVGASNPGDPEVPRLPEARAEALAVAGFLSQPKVFVGGDALASSIEAAAPHAALIHFAGHTSFADGGTRLLLAQPTKSGPDWLDARAFRSHEFANCRLVVLSACSTGKREERAFDDIQDIAQTLSAEGVQQIVATHWDVDSAASVSLMKDFYSGLARGLTVPQALLQAESAMSATAEYRHPYFWAPYYVIGIGKSSLKEVLHDD